MEARSYTQSESKEFIKSADSECDLDQIIIASQKESSIRARLLFLVNQAAPLKMVEDCVHEAKTVKDLDFNSILKEAIIQAVICLDQTFRFSKASDDIDQGMAEKLLELYKELFPETYPEILEEATKASLPQEENEEKQKKEIMNSMALQKVFEAIQRNDEKTKEAIEEFKEYLCNTKPKKIINNQYYLNLINLLCVAFNIISTHRLINYTKTPAEEKCMDQFRCTIIGGIQKELPARLRSILRCGLSQFIKKENKLTRELDVDGLKFIGTAGSELSVDVYYDAKGKVNIHTRKPSADIDLSDCNEIFTLFLKRLTASMPLTEVPSLPHEVMPVSLLGFFPSPVQAELHELCVTASPKMWIRKSHSYPTFLGASVTREQILFLVKEAGPLDLLDTYLKQAKERKESHLDRTLREAIAQAVIGLDYKLKRDSYADPVPGISEKLLEFYQECFPSTYPLVREEARIASLLEVKEEIIKTIDVKAVNDVFDAIKRNDEHTQMAIDQFFKFVKKSKPTPQINNKYYIYVFRLMCEAFKIFETRGEELHDLETARDKNYRMLSYRFLYQIIGGIQREFPARIRQFIQNLYKTLHREETRQIDSDGHLFCGVQGSGLELGMSFCYDHEGRLDNKRWEDYDTPIYMLVEGSSYQFNHLLDTLLDALKFEPIGFSAAPLVSRFPGFSVAH